MRQGIQAAMAGLFFVFLLGSAQAGTAYDTPSAPSASTSREFARNLRAMG